MIFSRRAVIGIIAASASGFGSGAEAQSTAQSGSSPFTLTPYTPTTFAEISGNRERLADLWSHIAYIYFLRLRTSMLGEDANWYIEAMDHLQRTLKPIIESGKVELSSGTLEEIQSVMQNNLNSNFDVFVRFMDKNGVERNSIAFSNSIKAIQMFELLSVAAGTAPESPQGSKCYFWPFC